MMTAIQLFCNKDIQWNVYDESSNFQKYNMVAFFGFWNSDRTTIIA